MVSELQIKCRSRDAVDLLFLWKMERGWMEVDGSSRKCSGLFSALGESRSVGVKDFVSSSRLSQGCYWGGERVYMVRGVLCGLAAGELNVGPCFGTAWA